MARTKKYSVPLSDDDVKRLKILIREKDTSYTISNRCSVLIDLDEEHPPILTYREYASKHGITMTTVANTAASYCKEGLDAMLKLKRNVNSDDACRKVDGRIEAKIIEIACDPVPEGHSRWIIRLLKAQMKVEPISREAIRRVLKNKLRPHRSNYWCLTSDTSMPFSSD